MKDLDELKARINKTIDDWGQEEVQKDTSDVPVEASIREVAENVPVERATADTAEAPDKPKPKPKSNLRVVRTKSTGDKVYLVNKKDMTKRWITNPQVLDGLGFSLNDVEEIDDGELAQYRLSAAVYKVDEES